MALAAVKGDRTLAQLAEQFDVPLRSFAADAHDCIMVRALDLPDARLWRD